MDFAYTPEQEALRRDVRAFIEHNVTPAVLADDNIKVAAEDGEMRPTGRTGPLMKELYRRIGERGWLGIAYPKEYGGQGGDQLSQFIVEEEFMRAGVSIDLGGSGAPAILAAGTEEQKQYFIPRLINREVSFCLGFSEPHAGADLANLRCRAVPTADGYVINGQKIYTTAAHWATHIYLMARTDPSAPKHDGISIFLIPMDTPGITVRPLWTIQNSPGAPHGTTYGEARTNETFFDDLHVPKTALLGEENKGWGIGAAALNLDRVGAWRYLMSIRRDEDIVNWLKENRHGPEALANNAAIRDKVAELWTEAQVCRLMTMRSMSIVQRGGKFTYEGSAEKVWAPEHGVKTTEAITQMLGPYAQLLSTSPHAIEEGVFAHNVMGAFQSGVNHGSVQIMRDQIARRGLNLPSSRKSRKPQ
ncbi:MULTISPECIES: acyl-CoA dehydrogenase family protein [Burkholderiaceae]|uniref:acyl-CoA dehydrogenase family protein n=1 Tax=Burkholderiaceae TaxID=119060 RepID=UPI00089A1E50|nr:acyl-CoA dehydrogenase family protein [Burkholderia sp. WP9]SEF13802.1 Acyl-CoA dehydrogenase [Burkholderia sp. WP9]